MEVLERGMEAETETDEGMETETESDEDMEIMVFQVTEIDLEYEFDAARWYDFTQEESPVESRVAELWFESAQSYPPSPFALKLLMMREEVSDEPSSKSEDDRDISLQQNCIAADHVNETGNEMKSGVFNSIQAGGLKNVLNQSLHKEDDQESDRDLSQQQQSVATDENGTGNEMRSGVFTFIQAGNLKNVPNQSLHKGPTFSNHIHTDKVKCRPKSSIRPIPRSSTLMKPTVSQLAKQDNARLRMQVDQKGLCPSSGSEIQASKRQKLDAGRLHKVPEMSQEINFVHKALNKDKTLERNLQFSRPKITVPQEPDFATSHRANRIRHKNDATLEQDSTSVYRFKARPFNRKIFEAPSLPIRKKSSPKLPEFQEFHLKTSERAMQHSSAGNNYHKGSSKPDTKAFLDGVNREPRRPRAADIPKDDDGKHIFKARPLENKIVSSRTDTGLSRKSKRETTVPLEFSFRSEKKVQQDLPTDLFSKLSIKPELQPNNGSRLRYPHQPEQIKGSKENRTNSFQAGNERTSRVQGGIWTTRR